MAGDDEVRARTALAEMQIRISEGPESALGLGDAFSPEDVRAAFLALTKQFHPARFGRMSADVQRLSNEVFLGIKGAHETLLKILGSPTKSIGSARGSTVGMHSITAEGTSRTAAHLARGTDRGPAPAPGALPTTRFRDPNGSEVASGRTHVQTVNGTAPIIRQGTPALGQSSPIARQATPASGQPLPIARQGTPAPGQTSPIARQGTPAPGQTSPVARQGTPASGPTSPVARQGTPAPGQTSPVSPAPGQTSPVARQGTPAPGQTSPSAKPATLPPGQTSPLARQGTPAPGQTSPVAKPATLPPGQTSPIAKPATLPPGQTSPMARPAPGQTSSIAKPATLPPGQTSPLARQGTPAPGQTSPLARQGTPPPGTTTPVRPGTLQPGQTSPLARQATPPTGQPLPGAGPRGSGDPFNAPTQRGFHTPNAPTSAPQQRTNTPPPPSATNFNVATQRGIAQVGAFDESSALTEALMYLEQGNWSAARQSLHALAAKVPQSKQYRALLCYARGREAHTAGRPEDALLEYQRALQLDPELVQVKSAVAELQRRR